MNSSPKALLEFRRLAGMEITEKHQMLAEAEEALEALESLWQGFEEGLAPTKKERDSNLATWASSAKMASSHARAGHKAMVQRHGGAIPGGQAAATVRAGHEDAIHAAKEAGAAATAVGKHNLAKHYARAADLHTKARAGIQL
jgi:hypothetical protein